MLGDDSLGANCVNRRIPYVIGINDHHRAMTALIHAPGVIHSHFVAESRGSNCFLENSMHLGRAGEGAGFSAGADKDVMTVLTHSDNLSVAGIGDRRSVTGDR